MDIKELTYPEITGADDFRSVVSIDFGGGYDWDSLEAWYSPSKRRFFWVEGSGCSCNSLGDGITSVDDLTSGNRDELASAVRAKYADGYDVSTEGLLSDLAAVKTFIVTK